MDASMRASKCWSNAVQLKTGVEEEVSASFMVDTCSDGSSSLIG